LSGQLPAPHDRLLRQVEDLGRLGDAHLLGGAQHKDDAEPLRQRVDRLLHDAAELARGRALLRIFLAGGAGRVFVIRLVIHGLEPPPPTGARERLVHRDLGEPRGKPGPPSELAEVLESPHVRTQHTLRSHLDLS
jgi:hypothetical protein